MKTSRLEKLQFYSLMATGIAVTIGFARTIIVMRILTPEEFGFVGLVIAVGAIVGVAQHFGIDSASAREISMTEDERSASKVFTVALLFRLLISLPLALVLFLGSKLISDFYNNPIMTSGLRILSVVVVLEGLQGVFGATLRALQRFKTVFGFQLLQASVSFPLFVLFTYSFRAHGYLYAMLFSLFIVVLSYIVVLRMIFHRHFMFPTLKEFGRIFRNIFAIGRVTFGLKVLHTLWLKAGLLIMAKYVLETEIGYFNFALEWGGKFALSNRAINSVNPPVLTKLWKTDAERFRQVFEESFQKLFVLGYSVLISAIVLSREIIIALGGTQYTPVFKIFPLIFCTFFVYFLFDLIGAGVIVPTKNLEGVLKVYFSATLGAILLTWALVWKGLGIVGASVGLFAGAIPILIYYAKIALSRLSVRTLDSRCACLTLILLPTVGVSFVTGAIWDRILSLSISLVIYFLVADWFGILRFRSYARKAFATGKALILNQKAINIFRLER